ncbi:MAG: hypothetical protein GF418_15645, partial [Chitinivibrionales bacterium]|nr:hypothetical protein [Chitinivibrionales bacterium]MBD3397055.1 hypothetical protein [Chitinivibrionales bacterium]
CMYGVEEAVEIAVDALCRLGHKRFGIPASAPFAGDLWFGDRIRLVRNALEKRSSSIRVFVEHEEEPYWKSVTGLLENQESILDLIRNRRAQMRAEHPRASRARLEELAAKTLAKDFPGLHRLCAERYCTAIIGINQWLAVCYYYWALGVGMDVPKELSIVGFDDMFVDSIHPVSTINFGLENLAYRVAHLLIGDIPVGADREGVIRSKPVLVDRGSLSEP